MPLAPRVARAVDLAIGEGLGGPIFVEANGRRLDRHPAGRIVLRIARRAGITKRVGPHTHRHADPRTTMRYDRGRQSLDRHATCIVATFIAGASR